VKRVALDTNGLYTTRAGVARFIRGLRKGLRAVRPPDLEIIEWAWPVENLEYRQPQRALKTAYRELWWARHAGPRLLHRQSIDLLHSTGNPLIQTPPGIREVANLNDLAILRHPERFRPWHRWSSRRRLDRFRAANRVICISQFTADEAMQLLGLPARQLVVVCLGSDFLDDEATSPEPPWPAEWPSEFFLFVGSLEPGKNLALLRETYRLAQDRRWALPPLMIVGARWAGVGTEGPPPAGWHYLGHQPDRILVSLYRRALALVFPSKYEGFGLPVVEAMRLGCPVICSPVASLPEVGGGAAVFAEMTPEAYLAALRRVCAEPAWRMDLVERGKVKAGQFLWRTCAQETAEVYRDVLR
jgi:glycosyltransferase involved in cell wall biosynthesis